MSHWATPYIGTPWKFGATGPDAFDCWNFACHVQQEHFNIEMIEKAFNGDLRKSAQLLKTSEEKQRWVPVVKPEDGDLVLMARRINPIHIGVWISTKQSNGILHCVQGSGVIFQSVQNVKLHGFGSLVYYRHHTKCMI